MSTTEEPIRLTIRRSSKVLEIQDGEAGEVRSYAICELLGSEKDEYRNLVNGREAHANGNPKDIRGLSEHWIGLCLRHHPSGDRVDPKVIAAWPAGFRDRVDALCDEVNSTYQKSAEAKKS